MIYIKAKETTYSFSKKFIKAPSLNVLNSVKIALLTRILIDYR